MLKNISFAIFFVVVTLCLSGCKSSWGTASSGTPAANYFQTDFQDESQFIVETIVSDIAEQLYYAKFHHLPATNDFAVSVSETADSSFSNPTYNVQVKLDSSHRDFEDTLNIGGPIWSPEVYAGLTARLAQTVGLTIAATDSPADTALLTKLTDSTAETIERENQNLSQALQEDFTNGRLHEKAALLLGAFALREHSGDFFEIRTPLCRLTAQLALARYLDGNIPASINGQVADAILYTLMNNETDALQKLKNIPARDAAVVSWVRALRARNTADYRPLDKLNGLTPLECVNWFYALDQSADTGIAWSRLSEAQKKTPDFTRIASENSNPIGVDRELIRLSLTLEVHEFASVYQMSQHKKLSEEGIISTLNQMPERSFSAGPDGQTGVRIIGWGLWAGFFQRHICHALQEDFDYLENDLGLPEDAKTFAYQSDEHFGELRLYPFVRRFNAIDADQYHESVDDGFKVTVATPQLVPSQCWDYLDYQLKPGEYYHPNPNPHINEWHKHNPPPGTAYDLQPRFDHPSLVCRPDSPAILDHLLQMAPYDSDLSWFVRKTKYQSHPTYAQALALFGPALPYSVHSMHWVAQSVENQPDLYEILYTKSATIDPSDYFTLADYCVQHQMIPQAVGYYEKGNQLDPDPVSVASHAHWLIQYYIKIGRTADARTLADRAGDAYSAAGLEAKAEFYETTGAYQEAYVCFSKIAERYNDNTSLLGYTIRHKAQTGDKQFDSLVEGQLTEVFPNGVEFVNLSNFQSSPADGVVIKEASDLATAAGLKTGDVIVAIDGVRTHTYNQYLCGREVSLNPEMDLIVWQGKGYREIKTSPPDRRFGGDFGDYSVNR